MATRWVEETVTTERNRQEKAVQPAELQLRDSRSSGIYYRGAGSSWTFKSRSGAQNNFPNHEGVPMKRHLKAPPVKRLLFTIGILLVVVPILPLILYGQAFYGSVVGTISDQSGGTLSGASVTLTNAG